MAIPFLSLFLSFLVGLGRVIINAMSISGMCHIIMTAWLFLFLFVLAGPEWADAALLPEEILVVVNSGSRDSVRLGKIYMGLRHIPEAHLMMVSLPMRDEITRRDYDDLLSAPLKRYIKTLQDKGGKIRCIVTTYGIPLRISAERPLGISEQEIKETQAALENKKEELSREEELLKKNKDQEANSKENLKQLRSEINRLNQKLGHLTGLDTVAAVDSELALLLFPPYPLDGWYLNPDALFFRSRTRGKEPVLMVSRLDASTPALAEGLVRTAIEVEKAGLSGKFYLDARGLTSKADAYGLFDEDIRSTAGILQKSAIPIVLNNRPELFGKGDAPDAALYCGWYSLAEYKDAFTWSKGAVGYHVASSECVSLHHPKPNYWVKRMIEKGVIATLGPVSEPYLTAFPPPSYFFPLLMSGRYTLSEVFAMTNPYLSWRMVLIGDPLYNPFKARPAFLLMDAPHPPG